MEPGKKTDPELSRYWVFMRTTGGPIIRGVIAVLSLIPALFCTWIAIRFLIEFVWPESGSFPGSAGVLLFAMFFLILAGPLLSITFVLAAPLFSDNPKWRGADTSN